MTCRINFNPALRVVLAGSVAASAFGWGGTAAAEVCRQDGREFAGDCTHYNAGTVVSRPAQANVSQGAAPDLGTVGFSISVDAAGQTAQGAAPVAPRTIAGVAARADRQREADRRLETAGVDLTYDGLGARPRLAIATSDLREGYMAGETVTFRASANYPAWIRRSFVVIQDSQGRTLQEVPIAANGTASWVMPSDTPETGAQDGEYHYFLRAVDAAGRRDETRILSLQRSATAVQPDLTGPVIAAGEGEDMTAKRGIPVRGGAITVSGRSATGQPVAVLGENIPVDAAGKFVTQRILPPGTHGVSIAVDGQRIDRSVTIEASEWFATGIVDLTAGRSGGETWKLGRLAGFAQGTLADGTKITASVDTQEEELRDLFRNFGRKNPDQTLREMKSEDVFATFGDDSTMTELAPTSGKLFLRADRDRSHIQWGDFKPRESTGLTVRSERALYGLSGEYRTPEVTENGDSRTRFTGFVAEADSLMQRDVLRATGGSAYFLSRRDILVNSESLYVQIISRTTGMVVETRRLSEGTDYRINAVQGVVIMNGPLSPSTGAGGLVSDNPLGDYSVNLVAQYEYVPTGGGIEGYTGGLRGETWASDNLRLGAALLKETSGIADNTLAGVDVLLRDGEKRELLLEYATSEGPGFGSTFSLNGGFDLEPSSPSYGLPGQSAASWRLAGRTDLDILGLQGEIAGYLDHKGEGFSSPDQDFQYDQDAWGLTGRVALTGTTALTFGGEGLRRSDGQREETARLGFDHQLDQAWQLEGEIAHDRREGASIAPEDLGRRLDAALRLTWKRDDNLSLWGFAQSTLSRDETRAQNDRIGVGTSVRLSEKLDMTAEVSEGSLGGAGRLEFGYRPDANTVTTIGYRLDPMRRFDTQGFSGRDRGSLVFGSSSRVNDRWSYTTESTYSAFGDTPALTSGYGVSYTPTDRWRYDGQIQYGESRETDGSRLDRRGLSMGVRYNEKDQLTAGLRGEWLRETSDRPGNALDRDTYLLSGFYETKLSSDWRFVSALDTVISDSDQSSFRDGRYIEAKLGYAWRPADNDRVNALFSYTYLYDLPGIDQVNIDGEVAGDRQKTHMLNAAASWQVSPVWTLGAKYGYRLRESAPRATNTFSTSEAHLGILRADFHVVHNWDILAEARIMTSPRSNVTETAGLLGVYRLFGDNLRVGGGYLHGRVDDDLRTIKAPKSGFFVNITSQF